MKKITLLLLSLIVGLVATAQPKLIGHRGSWWGVENTAEYAERNADKAHYSHIKPAVPHRHKRFAQGACHRPKNTSHTSEKYYIQQ